MYKKLHIVEKSIKGLSNDPPIPQKIVIQLSLIFEKYPTNENAPDFTGDVQG